MPKVSVVMPAYNSAPFIRETIESVQNQSFTDWELIVVNDGSVDNLAEIVEEMVHFDPRISLISQKNQGVAIARNIGIEKAIGEYVTFLDSDDIWLPTFLDKVTKEAENYGADVIYSGYIKERDGSSCKQIGEPFCESDLLAFFLKKQQGFHLAAFLFRKKMLDQFQLKFTPGCAYGEDIEFIVKALCHSQVKAVKEYLFMYKFRYNSLIHSAWNIRRAEALDAFQRASHYFEKKYQGEDRQELLRSFQRVISLLLYRTLMDALRIGDFQGIQAVLDKYSSWACLEMMPFSKRNKMRLLLSGNLWAWRALRLASRRLK